MTWFLHRSAKVVVEGDTPSGGKGKVERARRRLASCGKMMPMGWEEAVVGEA